MDVLVLVLIFSVLQLEVKGEDEESVAFYFRTEPADSWIELGGEVTLSCSTNTAVEKTWIWTLYSSTSDDVGSVLEGSSDTLVLGPASKEDHDDHFVTCAADVFGTRLISRYALIRIKFLEKEFLLEPSDVSVAAGSDHVRLDCVAPLGNPLPYITWTQDGALVDSSNTFVDPLGGLNILNTKVSHSGVYICIANSFQLDDKVTSRPATLTVSGTTSQVALAVTHDVSFAKARYKISARKGDSVRVLCGFLGNPTPSLTIKADSEELTNSAQVEVSPHGTWAVVDNVEDISAFKCEGSNTQGSQTMNIPVELTGTLEVAGGVEVNILEGDDLTLVCSDSSGEPNYSWYRNGVKLGGEEARYFQRQNPTRSDSGMYQCFAATLHSKEQSSFAVTVAGLVAAPVKITVNAAEYGLLGERLEISCVGKGNPVPSVTWHKKQGNSENAIRINDVTYKETFTEVLALLNVDNLTYEENGAQYICKGGNTDLYDSTITYRAERSVTVTVVEGLEPSISLPSTSVVTSGSPLTLICSVEGSPPPTIEWFQDRILIVGETAEKYVTDGESGEFGCKATNMLGTVEQYVRVQARPEFSGGEIFLILVIVGFVSVLLIVGILIFVRTNELDRRMKEARAKDELLLEKDRRTVTPSFSIPPMSPNMRPRSGMSFTNGDGLISGNDMQGSTAGDIEAPAVSEVECQTPRSILTPVNSAAQ